MKFGYIVEAQTPKGITHHQRYREMIEEAVFAEQAGFDFWGASEQHLLVNAGMSATEVMFAAVAAKTKTLRLRHMIRLLLKFNHPIRIAEQLATLDLVSDGRAELGTGRSNSILTLNAFQVNPKETRAQWTESLEIIAKALSQDSFSHDGRFWKIPEASLTPKPLQYPHPPLSAAATSPEMQTICGEKGIGCMSYDNYLGWEKAQEYASLYKKAIQNPKDLIGKVVNNTLSFLVLPAFCATTHEEAVRVAGPTAISFGHAVIGFYQTLAKTSPDYAYMEEIVKIRENLSDIEKFLSSTPGVMIGTPEEFVEKIKRLESMGYDEVILRVDGLMEHKDIMKSLEVLGKFVIPEFKSPSCIVKKDLFEMFI